MLLWFVKRLGGIYLHHFGGFSRGWIQGLGCCGQDREGPLAWRASSYEVTISRSRGPGAAGGSLAGQQDAAAE